TNGADGDPGMEDHGGFLDVGGGLEHRVLVEPVGERAEVVHGCFGVAVGQLELDSGAVLRGPAAAHVPVEVGGERHLSLRAQPSPRWLSLRYGVTNVPATSPPSCSCSPRCW